METEHVLAVDMVITPGEGKTFDGERLADILATIIPLVVETYCDGVVGGTVSVKASKENDPWLEDLLKT